MKRPRTISPWFAVLVTAWLALAGCSEPAQPETLARVPATPPNPLPLLREMVDAYRTANSYSDQGVFRLQYRQNGRQLEDAAPFRVRFARPNRLAVEAYQARIRCDGEALRAKLHDEPTHDLDGQVLTIDAAESWDLDSLFEDDVLRGAVAEGLGRHPLPLELLLVDQPLEAIFRPETARRLLTSKPLDGHACHRVEAETGEGPFIFWIDQENFALRRLEYPPQIFLSQIADNSVSGVRVVADFRSATFDEPLDDDDFGWRDAPSTRQVSKLLIPPPPPPTQLFGQRPPAYSFVTPDEGRLGQAELEGQVAVLLWFNDHPLGQAAIRQLNQIWAGREQMETFHFLAVCTEPSSRSTAAIQEKMDQWNVEMPWVRDLDACGRDIFQIPWAPTLVVLDQAGVVHAFEVGFNPELGDSLPGALDRLAAGESIADELLSRQRAAAAEYQRHLQSPQAE